MARPWIKLPTNLLHDPVMGDLSTSAYRLYIELLLTAGTIDNSGATATEKQLAWLLRKNITKVHCDLVELVQAGLVGDDPDGIIHIGQWERYAPPVRLPRNLTESDKQEIHERDNYTCVYCGAPSEHIDHVVPISRGGTDNYENLVASCQSCNLTKGTKLLSELGWTIGDSNATI